MNMRRPVAVLSAAVPAALALLVTTGGASAAEKTVEDWINQATMPGPVGTRLEAIRQLGSTSDPRVIRDWDLVGVLLALAGDPNPRLARAAIRELGKWARGVERGILSQIVGPLAKIATNKERHSLVRREAIRQLGQALKDDPAHQDVVTSIVRIAGDRGDEPEVRHEAFVAAGDIGSARARTVIRQGLTDKDDHVAEGAFTALRALLVGPKGKDSVDAGIMGILMQKLRSANTSVDTKKLIMEIIALIQMHGYKAGRIEDVLVDFLEEDEDAELVLAALKAISYMGGAKAAVGVASAYKRFGGEGVARGSEVRTKACGTAGALFDHWSQEKRKSRKPLPTRSVSALVDLLCGALKDDPDAGVKMEAAVSLGNLYDKGYDKRKAAMTLIVVVGHEGMGDDIKAAALDSLEVLTGKNFGLDAERWEEWYRKNQSKLAPKTR